MKYKAPLTIVAVLVAAVTLYAGTPLSITFGSPQVSITCTSATTADVTVSYTLLSGKASPVNLTATISNGDKSYSVQQTGYVADGIPPWSGPGSDPNGSKTYSASFTFTNVPNGTYSIFVTADQPGGGNSGSYDEQTTTTFVVACGTSETCPFRIFGETPNNPNLCKSNGTINFTFSGDFQTPPTVYLYSCTNTLLSSCDRTTVKYSKISERDGQSCNYKMQIQTPDSSITTAGYYTFVVGDGNAIDPTDPIFMDCQKKTR